MPASSSAPVQVDAVSPDKEENPELVRFRAEWLAELQKRKAASTSGNVVPSASPQTPVSALNVYGRAIEHEQRSELDQALLLYRQAFRLDDNVDRAYRREEMLKTILKEQQEVMAPKPLDEVDELATSFKEYATIQPTSAKIGPHIVTGTLASLVQGFLDTAPKFEPENENQPVLLNVLPEELLVVVLGKLDPTSIERFARVSKKARILSLDPGIWRKLVRRTYQPPQITDYEVIIPVIEGFRWDFRRVYIEHPRLRLDGVYIATCHYVRPGLSENSWVNTSHLITYHRYLRFYPNGQVLSLLANEEHTPQQIIPVLKPTLRMNGLFFGQWKLVGTTVHITNLVDASGRFALPFSAAIGPNPPPEPYSSSTSTPASGEHARYVFLMTLNLRSRPLGRWNRMDIQAYESLNIENGDVNPIVLKHERPFWFSKVRSYA
ncbi:hypothetical protein GALMADRAFT_91284 [Galerina marginata CBS 339.88]|uniref:F-box domain-containing protein n=1 Tax=Galerina marginata (strain CBS 339.88) TaxID=685588 RepID=A0A067TC25_GALM3|nr:hypothetical protein GALMADRAFT_91284 [Galerina marginata CBS 339.88]